jgi:integrase
VEALLSKFQQWEEVERQRVAKHGEKGKGKNYARRLMALCVRLLLASGMRPGKEILELTWADIQAVRLSSGQETISINRCGHGKTGRRVITCDPEAVEVIDDLRALLRAFGFATIGQAPLWPSPKGGIVQDMSKSFKSALRGLDLPAHLKDDPLYLCRHTYITLHLLGGVSSDFLATNCGTSVEMIERHYKHVTAEQIRDKVILPDTNNPVGLTKPSRTSRVAVRIAADGPVEPLVLS